MAEYVIIGNGVAAVGCIEGIRGCDKVSPITVISKENHPVYCRPLISYYLEGKTDSERMKYRPDSFYEENGCKVLYGREAVKIDSGSKTVLLENGEALHYTSLCVASGSSPFVPSFKGLETVEKKFSFMTFDDAASIEKNIRKDSEVLIVGAGLIGLKCAEGLKNRIKKITVCDLADRILSSVLDKESSEIMQKHLEENGIKFMLGDSVSEFFGSKAVMNSGKTVGFDVLVLAVGVHANKSLIKDAGGKTSKGIVVDVHMSTSLPDIFAAGDCTEGTDLSSGESKVIAIMPNACMQGFCAGKNMAGKADVYDKAFPMNSVGFFGLHAMTAGTTFDGKEGEEVFTEKNSLGYKRFFVKGGVLKGFIVIGNTERAGIYTNLIREKVPLDTVNFEMLRKYAVSTAFSPEIRRKMFGGVV